ncbi:hypothetical protein [Nonomuraea dietziae]
MSTRATTLFAFLEPDPGIEWDDDRVAKARRALEAEQWEIG